MKKIVIQHPQVLELIRLAIFAVIVVAALSLIDLMAFTGLYDLFSLTFSAGFAVAAGIILGLSIYLPSRLPGHLSLWSALLLLRTIQLVPVASYRDPASTAGNVRKPALHLRRECMTRRGSAISVGDVPESVLSGLHSNTSGEIPENREKWQYTRCAGKGKRKLLHT